MNEHEPDTTASDVALIVWGATDLPDGVTIEIEYVDGDGPDPDEHQVARVRGAAEVEVDYVCLTCGAQGDDDGHTDAQSWHDAL